MNPPVTPLAASPVLPAVLPGWALPRGRAPDELAAAGIALKSLDDLVRSAPIWVGCWRARQTPKCAAVAVRLMGRSEDEPALRDSILLTAVGDDPGPAGKVSLAYKWVCARKPAFSSKAVAVGVTLPHSGNLMWELHVSWLRVLPEIKNGCAGRPGVPVDSAGWPKKGER